MSRRDVLQLQLKGLFCPCLESKEDRMAREAFAFLQIKATWRVQWHRPLIGGIGNSQDNKSSGGFFKSLVSTVVSSTVGYNTCNAKFGITENPYGVAVQITKTDPSNTDAVDLDVDDKDDQPQSQSIDAKKSKRRERVILLRNIGVVEAASNSNGIVLYGTPTNPSSSSAVTLSNNTTSKGTELIRFDLTQGSKSDDEMQQLRDDMVDNLEIVCRWDRNRHQEWLERQKEALHAANDGESTQVSTQSIQEDEDGTPMPQRNMAQRAAHFAKREIELTKTRAEREQRKSKYMAASGGGLKYTALAMANRAMNEG